MSRTAQLTAAYAGAFHATYDVGENLIGRVSPAARQRVLSAVFANNASLSNSVATLATSRTASIATTSLWVASRVAGGVAVAMSGMMAWEGFKREDTAAAVGNGLMAVGSLVLLLGAAGPLALVAAAAIAIGFVFTLFANDDAQNWVKQGFWGDHGTYWGEDRVSLSKQIDDAKALANPNDTDYNRIQDFFDRELATYIDINADLKVEDGTPGDGRIEIYCALLNAPADLSKLRVNAWEDRAYPRDNFYPELTITWIAPGVVHVWLTESRYEEKYTVKIDVEVDRSHNGETTGEFTADLNIEGSRLW